MSYKHEDAVELWPANKVSGLHNNGLKLLLHFPEDMRTYLLGRVRCLFCLQWAIYASATNREV